MVSHYDLQPVKRITVEIREITKILLFVLSLVLVSKPQNFSIVYLNVDLMCIFNITFNATLLDRNKSINYLRTLKAA